MNWFHRHKWVTVIKNAVGKFEKQQGQGNRSIFHCTGELQFCGCQIFRILPADKRLHPVRVEEKK